ncbi:MAG: transposase [Acidobacteriota bacterium]|nr:transposase [Acidobacteriota bacterium]
MTQGLIRYQQSGQSHFVTFSCYHREAKLKPPGTCQLFLEVLEAAHKRFSFRVYGYVLMPEHVHLLISEPDVATLAHAIKYLKSSTSKSLLATRSTGPFWQARYHDRNVRDAEEFRIKLRYLHRNPVKRGLCESPEFWPWSSFGHYVTGERGVVEIESAWTAMRRERGGNGFPG